MKPRPLILAHRGDSKTFAENTMPAFESAFSVDADGLEIDVQLTRDGRIAVIHDETVDRVADGKGWVGDRTYDELSVLNAAHHRPDLEACRIPLLEEVLELIQGTDKVINIELKDSVRLYPGLIEAAMAMVQKMGVQEQIIYSSFNHYSMARIKELDKDAVTGLLYSHPLYKPWKYAEAAEADALHPDYRNLRIPGYMAACRERGLMVNVWTVDGEKDILQMLKADVDAIITNVPALALQLKQGQIGT